MSDDLPDVRFGDVDASKTDWRKVSVDSPDDDAELERTPPDVVKMLGFDPKKEAPGDEAK